MRRLYTSILIGLFFTVPTFGQVSNPSVYVPFIGVNTSPGATGTVNIDEGTITTDIQGFNFSVTVNSAGLVAHPFKIVYNDTTSAAGSQPFGVYNGATPEFTVRKDGVTTIASSLTWTGATALSGTTDGLLKISNSAVTQGVVLDASTSALKVRNLANSADAVLNASQGQFSASTGVSLTSGAKTIDGSATSGTFTIRQGGAVGNDFIFTFNNTENFRLTQTGLMTFGGTSASFPALIANGAGLDIKLADNSAYTTLRASAIGIGAAPGAAGTISASSITATSGTSQLGTLRLTNLNSGDNAVTAITIANVTGLPSFPAGMAVTTIKDANANPFILSSATASAVDGETFTNAATATIPTVTIAASGTDTNITQQISGKGTGLVTYGSIEQAPSNIVRLDAAFTDANASGLQNITGLSWTMPANMAVIWPFHCRLVVNQNTAAVVDTIGIQDVTVAPTYIQATGVAETALTAAAFGDLGAGLTTTTATGILSFTPGAIGTNLTVLIDGIINQPSNASSSVIQMMIQQATAADTIIVQKGSFCSFGGTS